MYKGIGRAHYKYLKMQRIFLIHSLSWTVVRTSNMKQVILLKLCVDKFGYFVALIPHSLYLQLKSGWFLLFFFQAFLPKCLVTTSPHSHIRLHLSKCSDVRFLWSNLQDCQWQSLHRWDWRDICTCGFDPLCHNPPNAVSIYSIRTVTKAF